MSLQQDTILSVLNKVLHQVPRIRKGTDAVYFCPKCHHYKKKLEVSLLTGKYNCWVCGFSGLNLGSLLKKLNAPRECYGLIGEIRKTVPKNALENLFAEQKEVEEIHCLPDDFIPLYENGSKSVIRKHAMSYLKKRGISLVDIYRYNIGYCEKGQYKNRIVIPSYDVSGGLNFYSCRDFFDISWLKYVNCEFNKNVIGFEMLTNFSEEITLVEGAFDAISVRRNAIPLFGKTLSDALKLKILIFRPPVVNVLLDNDALKDAIKICGFLLKNDITTRLITLTEKDASVLGYEKTWEHINNSKILEFTDLFKLKIAI